ncbi:MAG: response regulator [Synechococcales cyanobacterium CRU_2_2]|nr:response regulator [Synechococcales cyanobacterium CRU_2_2]
MASHKILVIDDSKVIRMRVQDMLPTGNFEILEAKDGLEGLRLIREERPTLIMLDFLLPKMNGWEVFQNIQADSSLQAIPLVVMSGRKEEVTEKLPEPFEYFEFIEKPFEKEELILAIKSAMMKARKRPQTAAIAATPTATSGAGTEEVAALKARIETLETEVAALKKQLGQVVAFVRQKLA